MEVMPIAPEIVDHLAGSVTFKMEVPVAPHAAIPGYRGKVYRALLNLEMDRFSSALYKNDTLLFPKSPRLPGK